MGEVTLIAGDACTGLKVLKWEVGKDSACHPAREVTGSATYPTRPSYGDHERSHVVSQHGRKIDVDYYSLLQGLGRTANGAPKGTTRMCKNGQV